MEIFDQLSESKLEQLVKQIMGDNWCVSPHTEIYSQNEPFQFYQEWNLHLDEFDNNILTDHIRKKFTLYYIIGESLELQLIIILNVIKENHFLKKNIYEYN